jgi:hypothetical protein
MEQQDEVLLRILRRQWGLAEELQRSFIANEFEREAGFHITFHITHQFFFFFFFFPSGVSSSFFDACLKSHSSNQH